MPVEVRPVASKREYKAFMRLPWRLYRNEPHWVPPLLMDLKGKGPTEARFLLSRDGASYGGP